MCIRDSSQSFGEDKFRQMDRVRTGNDSDYDESDTCSDRNTGADRDTSPDKYTSPDRNTGTDEYASADTSPDRWGDYFGW